MAWTTPRRIVPGEMMVAATLNQYLRDNLAYLWTQEVAIVRRDGAAASHASGSEVTIIFDTEEVDTAGMVNIGTQPTRITFTSKGKYMVGGCMAWQANANGVRNMRIHQVQVTANLDSTVVRAVDEGFAAALSIVSDEAAITADVGDYIYLSGSHNAGVALNNAVLTPEYPLLWAARMGI